MPMRLNHYVIPENDRMYRFHIPLSHFRMYAIDMENYLLNKQIKAFDNEEEIEDYDEHDHEEDNVESTWKYFLGDRYTYTI